MGENVLAKMVIDAVPSVEMVRFTNSDTVIKFEGCYHGHADSFLVQAGSGVATLGLPDSPGVPASATAATLCAQYNDIESVKKIFEDNKDEIAAVILEPLREITTENGSVLVFDEVMTGFRVAYGGAQ